MYHPTTWDSIDRVLCYLPFHVNFEIWLLGNKDMSGVTRITTTERESALRGCKTRLNTSASTAGMGREEEGGGAG